MRRLRTLIGFATILIGSQTGAAWAGDQLVVGAGVGDFIRNQFLGGDFRFEYRTAALTAPVLGTVVGGRLWGGVEVMTNGFFWGGGGVLAEVPIGPIVIIPQFGVGAYQRGSGKDLGATIEFRSAVELAYQFRDESRVALSFSHTSNAGITRRNPGIEALTVNYQVPLAKLFGSR